MTASTSDVRELAARRLGRTLTAGEARIDIVGLDRDLAAGKATLLAALRRELRRAARDFARDSSRGIDLRVSPAIRSALRALYDDGVKHGRDEVRRAGYDPAALPAARRLAASTRARLSPKLATIETRIAARLDELGPHLAHRAAISIDLGELATSKIAAAVERLPGIASIAADFTSPAAYAGLGSVWDQADAAGITQSWTYSAVMDNATCDVCDGLDGSSYESWDAIQDVLPDGGPNPDCDGGSRCRCRAVPEFGEPVGGDSAD